MSSSIASALNLTADLSSATILVALEISDLAYDIYANGILTTKAGDPASVDSILKDLAANGWTEIPQSQVDASIDATTHYQGVALYKVINGVTEVIIANRGSQPGSAPSKLYDYTTSDATLAVGGTPPSDASAVAYYQAVVSWLNDPANGIGGPISIIETGHSLGGQEADYVVAQITNDPSLQVYSTEAVTFDAPGLGYGVKQAGVTYNALNISASNDLVHVGGALLNDGYAGVSVTIKAGTSLVPFAVEALIGLGTSFGATLVGLGEGIFYGLYKNHEVDVIYSYLQEHPALGGVDLQTYSPTSINETIVAAMARMSVGEYEQMSADQRAAFYSSMLAASNGSSSATTNASQETFTATATDSGVTLQGSKGDSITLNESGTAVTMSDNTGNTEVLTFSADGSMLQEDDWTRADGSHGTDHYRNDGSSYGRIDYAGGGYATYFDDGQGNLTTDYYSSAGNLFRDSWSHSDGTSGSDTFFPNGLTVDPTSTSSYSVPQSGYGLVLNPDGSYETYSYNPQDEFVTTTFDSSGAIIGESEGQGAGRNFDNSNTTSETSTDGAGNTTTRVYDASGDLISDSWSEVDGTSGSDTYNASGIVVSEVKNADGSSERYFKNRGTTTHDHFDSSGVIVSDEWSVRSGAHGHTSFNTDGSGNGVITHANGTTSTVILDAAHDLTIDNLDSQGNRASEDWWHNDGTRGVTVYHNDNSSSTFTYLTNGQVQEVDYAPDGSVAATQTVAAGAVMSPDGSDIGKVANADGSYSIDYVDSNGDSLVLDIDASGQLKSSEHLSTVQASEFGGTLPDGTDWSGPYNGFTPTYTDANGTQFILYENNNGNVTAQNWTASDGSHGYDTYESDGSRKGVSYSADGSYYAYTNDGQGDITTDYYDASGDLTGDAWQEADGSHGYDAYNADGSSAGRSDHADGSYIIYNDDGQGRWAETEYSATGTPIEDRWTNPDGSYGFDLVETDGSIVGATYETGGNYSQYFVDAAGIQKTTDYYNSGDVLTKEEWTRIDGSKGDIVYDADGSRVSIATDAAGNSIQQEFSPAGALTGDSWTHTDGSYGSDTFNADGSSSGVAHNADGTHSEYDNDGLGDLNTNNYDSSDNLIGDSWRDADGSSGTDVYDADGSSSGITNYVDGRKDTYAYEANGDSQYDSYDAAGVLVSDSWFKHGDSSGTDTFNADGSSSGVINYLDGRRANYTNDGHGDIARETYSANGVLLANAWTESDGLSGTTQYGSNGSIVGTTIQGGAGNDIYRVTPGTVTVISPAVSSGVQVLALPSGMLFSDFTASETPEGDLILRSTSGDTTAVIKGFYESATVRKKWLLADDSETPQILSQWAPQPRSANTDYASEIESLRQAYVGKLGITLNEIGQHGGTILNKNREASTTDPNNTYQFNGVTTQNIAVQNGELTVGSSENDQYQYSYADHVTTRTTTVPVYGEVTIAARTQFLPLSSDTRDVSDSTTDQSNGFLFAPVYSNGQLIGYNVTIPATSAYLQTGTKTVTETIHDGTFYSSEAQSFVTYNITGDGGDDVITADGPFSGSVVTGDGNVYVNLGEPNAFAGQYFQWPTTATGAFIEGGNGNDTLIGAGGVDVIAAGTGFDYLSGGIGTTYYVPMTGDSTDIIDDAASPYGGGPFQQTTLVLPKGVTPQNLQYRIFAGSDPDYPQDGSAILQLKYGDSSVLVHYGDAVIGEYWGDPSISRGVTLFQFADGTILTRDELIAQATLMPNDFNPIAHGYHQTVAPGHTVSAASFFSGSDNADNSITWYRVTNSTESGGYFVLNGKAQAAGQSFYVSEDQLSQLFYVAGTSGATDSVQVSAFDGAIWSGATSFSISAAGNGQYSASASGPDEIITGSVNEPSLLTGGYAGDVLIGQSGQDTFVYNLASGAESLVETAATSSSSNNVLQFGSGITPDMISLSVDENQQLVLTIGTAGDRITIENFDPTDPLNSVGIQQFVFADGTRLTLAQLLSQTQSTESSGTITRDDGSVTTYDFDSSSDRIYGAATYDSTGRLLRTFALHRDGATDVAAYTYHADASYVLYVASTTSSGETSVVEYDYGVNQQLTREAVTNADGSTAVYLFNDLGQLTEINAQYADGSSVIDTYSYNADGSYVLTVVSTAAGTNAATTVTYSYNASQQLINELVTNPDGSTAEYQYNATGQLIGISAHYADGSIVNDTYSYAMDGSYTLTAASTAAGAAAPTTVVYSYNSSQQLIEEDVTNADGSTANYTFNTAGQLIAIHARYVDGSLVEDAYQYNSDGSYSLTAISTAAGASSSMRVVYEYAADQRLTREAVTNTDGSSAIYLYNANGRLTDIDTHNADGSSAQNSYEYSADGGYTLTVVSTAAGAASQTTVVYSYDASQTLIEEKVTNADGSTADYTFNGAGQLNGIDSRYADGSTTKDSYLYGADGSYTLTVTSTAAGATVPTTIVYSYDSAQHLTHETVANPDNSTASYFYNTSGQLTEIDALSADGSRTLDTYSYAGDGSYTLTAISTPTGSSSTTVVYSYGNTGGLLTEAVSNPDGSTATYDFNANGTLAKIEARNADGSTVVDTYDYNSNGSYSLTVKSSADGTTASSIATYEYDAAGAQLSVNVYQPSADGSYSDDWALQDGTYGSYWWNASTHEYADTTYHTDGSHWSDDYVYASGTRPGSGGASYLETFSASDGDQGSRQYDATTDVTTVHWNSAATGSITVSSQGDSGFIGFVDDEAPTQTDLNYFNPAVSPSFSAMLAAH